MLFVLYGTHTGMGLFSREYFRRHNVEIINKLYFCEDEEPALTSHYEPRKYVDELTFYKNTDSVCRYTLGNIHFGFSLRQIREAAEGDRDYLLTLSTQQIDIIRELRKTFRSKVIILYVYTDFSILRSVFEEEGYREQEIALRLEIGRAIKDCHMRNPLLFDGTIFYGGEESLTNEEKMEIQYDVYINASKSQEDSETKIMRYLEDIKKDTSHISSQVDLLVDVNDYLKAEKTKFENHLSDDEKKDDRYISRFITETSNYIDDVLHPPAKLESEREHLRQLFGNRWKYLMKSTQKSLVSSGFLLKQCADIRSVEFDFSGICICATAALEAELKRVFFDGFLDYMEKTYGHPGASDPGKTFEDWPETLIGKTKEEFMQSTASELKPVNYFTIGSLPYLFGEIGLLSEDTISREHQLAQSEMMRRRMSEYLEMVVRKEYFMKHNCPEEAGRSETEHLSGSENLPALFYKPVVYEEGRRFTAEKGCFVWKCNKIRTDYRNKAAHVDVMSKKDAIGCYQSIIEKPGFAEAYLCQTEITGVLLELFDKIDGKKLANVKSR